MHLTNAEKRKLRDRVKVVKPIIAQKFKGTDQSYLDKVIERLPELNTARGGQRIENIWGGSSTDPDVTRVLEEIALEIEPSLVLA